MIGLLVEWETFSHCGCTHVESVDQGFVGFLIMSQLKWENNSGNFYFIHLFLRFSFIYSNLDNNIYLHQLPVAFHLSHFY